MTYLIELQLNEKWRTKAACKGLASRSTVPDLFYSGDIPGRKPQDDPKRTVYEQTLCQRCPVRVECLDYAMREKEQYGIWGGLKEKERRTLHRLRIRTRHEMAHDLDPVVDEIAEVLAA